MSSINPGISSEVNEQANLSRKTALPVRTAKRIMFVRRRLSFCPTFGTSPSGSFDCCLLYICYVIVSPAAPDEVISSYVLPVFSWMLYFFFTDAIMEKALTSTDSRNNNSNYSRNYNSNDICNNYSNDICNNNNSDRNSTGANTTVYKNTPHSSAKATNSLNTCGVHRLVDARGQFL